MDLARLSDEALAKAFLAGDQSAFETLVTRYSRPIVNFAYRFLGNGDDADDVAQATFVQVYTHLERARLDEPLKPWIYQIARNKAIDLLRSRRQLHFSDLTVGDDDSVVMSIADDAPLPEAIAERNDLQRLLGDAIQALAPKYRQVVAMRYTSDLTFKEMGDVLGMPENSVKTLFQRAKSQLRGFLQDYAP